MTEDSLIERAREWINTGAGRCVAVGAGLALLVGAVLYLLRDTTARERQVILDRGRRVLYYCKACHATGTLQNVPYDQKFPVACPKCRQPQAVIGFRCVGCPRTIEKQNKPVYRCPHCGFLYDNRLGPEPGAPPPGPESTGRSMLRE